MRCSLTSKLTSLLEGVIISETMCKGGYKLNPRYSGSYFKEYKDNFLHIDRFNVHNLIICETNLLSR